MNVFQWMEQNNCKWKDDGLGHLNEVSSGYNSKARKVLKRVKNMDQDYELNNIPNWNIMEFLNKKERPNNFVLMTCLDSSPMHSPALDYSWLINDLKSNKWFFGFDEIYFIPNYKITPFPRHCKGFLNSPNPTNTAILSDILNWMQENNCNLGIGDGFGLNYIRID